MTSLRFLPALALAVLAAPAVAIPGGRLDTLELGSWFCELPGDAVTAPQARPDESFSAVPDSSYTTADGGHGTYLLLGDQLVMTSGPRKGDRFLMDSTAMAHKLAPNGEPTLLRCVRGGDHAAMAAVDTMKSDMDAALPN